MKFFAKNPSIPTQFEGSTGSYFPWLDALRAVSWFLVMFGHTTHTSCFGRMGVGIFFAISGWLITKIILSQSSSNQSLTLFYSRRFLRIIPLFYVLIACTAAVSFFFPGWKSAFPFIGVTSPDFKLVPYLFTFSSEFWRGGGGGSLVGHTWSLCVEERFYVFWPLLLMFWPRHGLARRTLIAVIILFSYFALSNLSSDAVTTVLWAIPFPLLFGCALAIFFPTIKKTYSALLTVPIAVVLLGLYFLYASKHEAFSATLGTFSVPAGLLTAGMVACAVWTNGEPKNLLFRLMKELGKLSYAAYLFHPIFAYVALSLRYKYGIRWLPPLVSIAMVAPFAFLLHRYIESPFLKIRSRIEKSKTARRICAFFQVTPIVLGFWLFFPWAEVLSGFKAYSHLRILLYLGFTGIALPATYFVGRKAVSALLVMGRRVPDKT